MAYLAMILFVIILLFFVPSPLKTRRRIPTIPNPVLGVLNLMGPSTDAEVQADLEQLAQYFSEVRQADDVSPACHVLLVYCKIDSDGEVVGSAQSLKGIITDSGAVVAVVATNNTSEQYMASGARLDSVNFIMTIDRKGPILADFLAQLFAQMKGGVSMPIAWVNIGQMHPGADHSHLPAVICGLGFGQIAFR